MSPIKSWLKKLCAVCLILLLQGPAMLVQEVAWAKMLVSYTQEKGLARGVVETFDGKHPCNLCTKAEDLRRNEGGEDPQNQPQEKKPVRVNWGEMNIAVWFVVPIDPGTDCVTWSALDLARMRGRGKDSPVLPPPERA